MILVGGEPVVTGNAGGDKEVRHFSEVSHGNVFVLGCRRTILNLVLRASMNE